MRKILTGIGYLAFTTIFVGVLGIIWNDTTVSIWLHLLFTGTVVLGYVLLLVPMLEIDDIL